MERASETAELKGDKDQEWNHTGATFITSDPGHEKHKETREPGKTRRSKDGTFTKKKQTFFCYKGHILTDDSSVPFIKSYAVTTASVHDSKIDPVKKWHDRL